MKLIKPISTKIIQCEKIDNDLYLILEDYYKFEGVSNLYLRSDKEIIWYAELPNNEDIYVNSYEFHFNNNVIKCFTWEGFNVDIDAETGKIINKIFVK